MGKADYLPPDISRDRLKSHHSPLHGPGFPQSDEIYGLPGQRIGCAATEAQVLDRKVAQWASELSSPPACPFVVPANMKTVFHPYHEILLRNEKEQAMDKHNYLDESRVGGQEVPLEGKSSFRVGSPEAQRWSTCC